jgi:phosphatidylserine/phosphatidylglycerophosphate/cardiolipin synthase-like enzyme
MKKILLVVSFFVLVAGAASAQDVLCDSQRDPCRERMLAQVRAETQGIVLGAWFITDLRWVSALVARKQAGVDVRVIADTRSNAAMNLQALGTLAAAHVPIRVGTSDYVMHWKMIALEGQGVAEFSGANFQPGAWTANIVDTNWIDEMIFTTQDPSIVSTVLCAFDDLWTSQYVVNYANSPVAVRRYHEVPHDPAVNVQGPDKWNGSYGSRTIAAIDAESKAIDLVMFRFGDVDLTSALVRAIQRGVAVRVVLEPAEYRNVKKPAGSTQIDRIAAAFLRKGLNPAAHMRKRTHAGLTHQKTVILHGQQLVISGSSNWTTTSTMAGGQHEMNLFSMNRPEVYRDASAIFSRKWYASNHFAPFVPLKPTTPVITSVVISRDARLTTITFDSGPFSDTSDVMLNGVRVVTITNNQQNGETESVTLRDLPQGVYGLQIVNRTPAGLHNQSIQTTITVRQQ